jgi:hypothetical protein
MTELKTYYPPIFINNYLQQKLGPIFGAVPMFPTAPTDILAVTDGFSIDDLTIGNPGKFRFNGQAAIYDRIIKMRRSSFPHIKSEELLYYFFALTEDAIENVIEAGQHIQHWLDREDESAEEINNWIKSQLDENGQYVYLGKSFNPVSFHRLKVYQIQETRDIINFGTARTFAGNKMIIDFDYHQSEPATNLT